MTDGASVAFTKINSFFIFLFLFIENEKYRQYVIFKNRWIKILPARNKYYKFNKIQKKSKSKRNLICAKSSFVLGFRPTGQHVEKSKRKKEVSHSLKNLKPLSRRCNPTLFFRPPVEPLFPDFFFFKKLDFSNIS